MHQVHHVMNTDNVHVVEGDKLNNGVYCRTQYKKN